MRRKASGTVWAYGEGARGIPIYDGSYLYKTTRGGKKREGGCRIRASSPASTQPDEIGPSLVANAPGVMLLRIQFTSRPSHALQLELGDIRRCVAGLAIADLGFQYGPMPDPPA